MRLGGNRVGCYFTNHRTNARDAEKKICNRTCGDNRRPLSHGFIVESVVAQFRHNRLSALIQHFDVTAEGNHGDHIFRTVSIGTPPKRFPKTDRKALDTNTAAPGNPEMTKFMHGDKHPQCDDECSQIPENTQHKTFR